jgi:hypothetical protein
VEVQGVVVGVKSHITTNIGFPHFAVGSGHFQLAIICSLLAAFGVQPCFENAPIFAGVITVGQNSDNINNRKIPLFLFFVPNGTNILVLKQFYAGRLCHIGFYQQDGKYSR